MHVKHHKAVLSCSSMIASIQKLRLVDVGEEAKKRSLNGQVFFYTIRVAKLFFVRVIILLLY